VGPDQRIVSVVATPGPRMSRHCRHPVPQQAPVLLRKGGAPLEILQRLAGMASLEILADQRLEVVRSQAPPESRCWRESVLMFVPSAHAVEGARHNGKSDCWFTNGSARVDEDGLEATDRFSSERR
jgi:hypothetical protein